MSRALLVLYDDKIRDKAADWVRRLPKDTRVTFQAPRRTLDQNAKMHAMIADIARQHEHAGELRSVKQWKWLFMHLLGAESVEWLPSLTDDGDLVPVGTSTREMSVAECSEMIELLYAKGAEWGVVWTEPERWRHAPPPREAAE